MLPDHISQICKNCIDYRYIHIFLKTWRNTTNISYHRGQRRFGVIYLLFLHFFIYQAYKCVHRFNGQKNEISHFLRREQNVLSPEPRLFPITPVGTMLTPGPVQPPPHYSLRLLRARIVKY